MQVVAGGWMKCGSECGSMRARYVIWEFHRRCRIHLCREGDEYKTLVLDAPHFKERIELMRLEGVWWGDRRRYMVLDVRVVGK